MWSFCGEPADAGFAMPASLMQKKIAEQMNQIILALRAGFEPATCPLGGGRAIQLCHRSVMQARVLAGENVITARMRCVLLIFD